MQVINEDVMKECVDVVDVKADDLPMVEQLVIKAGVPSIIKTSLEASVTGGATVYMLPDPDDFESRFEIGTMGDIVLVKNKKGKYADKKYPYLATYTIKLNTALAYNSIDRAELEDAVILVMPRHVKGRVMFFDVIGL